ncbi:glycosyltransferase family 4 protein [Photobacterium galatheae]|uniref:Glycosyl transferase family 1 domain-containing protein n=1 Tax=Photobacterium galatheae TaxID=1654360 RepID=A0A066RSF8_9GAMM|nr:glycosyltransferase family 4 protein [Photobacterium galatheae]KDM93390.1 hypothetical protein EA58_00535 [Photobacterium galatheae]MCM0146969.1 glycosyltransferase family 4 protein [Photobacterium galatheae]
MAKSNTIFIIDPIAFGGGSKNATVSLLKQLPAGQFQFRVLTNDPESWPLPDCEHIPLWRPRWLPGGPHGLGYLMRHLLTAAAGLKVCLKYGQPALLLGASGPGVDFSLFLIKKLTGWPVLQLIHGPVGHSRLLGRSLSAADRVCFLESCQESLTAALHKAGYRFAPSRVKFLSFTNGLCAEQWPSACQYERPRLLWAASLLKWKGLDLLIESLESLPVQHRPETEICYLTPRQTQLSVSEAGHPVARVHWHENPFNLDAIRSRSNLFVSTSVQEPFGLSILEAMAAGHCVVIPSDGAYWDSVLMDGIHCIKYPPGDCDALAHTLLWLSQDMTTIQRIGTRARQLAENYSAETCYQPVVKAITELCAPTATDIPPKLPLFQRVKERIRGVRHG